MGHSVRAIALILLSAWSCFGQAFTFNDLAFVCQSNVAAAWAPTNAYGWWYAGSMLPKANGTGVTNWPDSVSTHNLTTNNAAASPYFTNSIINSLPAVYFATAASRGLTNAFGTTLSQPVTYFLVALMQNIGGTPAVFDGIDTSLRNTFTRNLAGDGVYLCGLISGGGGQSGGTAITNQWCVYTVCFSGANSFVRTNGVLNYKVSSTPGANGTAGITLGGRYDGSSTYRYIGWVSELILYNGLPATNDMQWVESNLKTKYGL